MNKKIILISPYPPKNTYSHKKSSLASFSKNLVNSLKNRIDFIILSDTKDWKRNDYLVYLKLLNKIRKYKNIKDILIQFEWKVFGDSIFFIITFPFFLFLLKILQKRIYIVLHGIAFDFNPILGNNLKVQLLNLGSYIFYSLTCLLSNKIIVTENFFKKQLSGLTFCKEKVCFIPHGVDINLYKKSLNKTTSSQDKFKLGFFGYLNIYKGPYELLKLFNSINNKNYTLTFFGGKSPNLLKDKTYQNYIKNFFETAKKNNIKITGFIKETNLNKYFHETDLVIFPYLSFISSSGILAMTFSYEKPFILSKPLEKYFESPDFKETLEEVGLKKEDFLFDLTKESLEKRLNWAKKNLKKLAEFSRIMKEKRAWSKVAEKYEKVIQET